MKPEVSLIRSGKTREAATFVINDRVKSVKKDLKEGKNENFQAAF